LYESGASVKTDKQTGGCGWLPGCIVRHVELVAFVPVPAFFMPERVISQNDLLDSVLGDVSEA